MPIEKKSFRRYNLSDKEPKNKPLAVKLNQEDQELIQIGQWILNQDSQGYVLKSLARIGLKVILRDFGAKEMHYLTRGDRVRTQFQEPQFKHFDRNGNARSD